MRRSGLAARRLAGRRVRIVVRVRNSRVSGSRAVVARLRRAMMCRVLRNWRRCRRITKRRVWFVKSVCLPRSRVLPGVNMLLMMAHRGTRGMAFRASGKLVDLPAGSALGTNVLGVTALGKAVRRGIVLRVSARGEIVRL